MPGPEPPGRPSHEQEPSVRAGAAPERRGVAAWVLYDLANTIFALGVPGLYFATWVTVVSGAPDGALAIASASAMVVVIVLGPWVGARTDHRGRRVPTLRVTTLVAVAGTALLAELPLVPSLVVFSIALVAFNLGSVVYDALLPEVSTPETRGRISGLGVGVGYVGSAIAILAGSLMLDRIGYAGLFKVLAGLFLLFSLPAFLLIRERRRPPRPGAPPRLGRAVSGLVASWKSAAGYRGVTRFLVGRFLYSDAINTLIGGFLVVFAQKEVGFTEQEVQLFAAAGVGAAVLGGLVGGVLVDRYGPRRYLHSMIGLWMLAIAAGIVAAVADLRWLAWALGVAGGIALGGTWSADRTYMARIAPPARFGEFYGLYSTVGRFATVLGPLMWALIVDVFGLSRNWAMAALIGYLIAARLVLAGVDDAPRRWSPEDAVEVG